MSTPKELSTTSSKLLTNEMRWAGTHIASQFHQHTHEVKDWILIDNQSSVTIFCNNDMVENLCESTTGSMSLATNGGILTTNLKADLPKRGEVSNIFSYAEMAYRYHITCNSKSEDAFLGHLP
jgi:hypothetical protein